MNPMKCRRAQRMINDFLDGAMGDRDRHILEEHLAGCASCDEMAKHLAKSLELLHRMEPVQPDENFTWNVRLRIAREKQALAEAASLHAGSFGIWNRRFAVSAVAAFAVVLFGGYAVMQSSGLLQPGIDSPIAQRTPRMSESKVSHPVSELARQSSGAVQPRPVTTLPSTLQASDFEGPLQQDTGPALDMDLLLRRFRDTQVTRQRVRRLQEQVDLLTDELRACGLRCGEGAAADSTAGR
jgi:hypothetical protein